MEPYPIVGPAGSNGEVQFNKNQLFGADSNLFWDDTNKYLGIQTNAPEVTLNLETGNVQIGMQADSYYCTLSTNSLSFNRASGASYINQEGVGGSIICRVSNAGVNDRTAFTVANTGNVTFGYSITAANYTAANLLTACATNAGELDFTVASKKLDVEDNAVVSQDYTSDATPTFAGLTFTGGAFSLTPSTGDTDVVITFAGTTFSGVLRWMEDEDYFKFDDKVICPNLDVATLTKTRRLNINNGESSALTSFSSPIIYGTSGGGGSYPFNEAGNLVLSPRLSGANRDVLFITDSAGSNIAMVIQESGYVGFGETAPETFSEWTSTAPYLTLHNSTHEDADGGQESRLIFKGEDSAGSEEIIAQIEASKDGATATENAGKLVFSTRESVANGDTLTECFRLSADGSALFQNNTDSTTGFQVLDADGGTPVLNVDTTNERIGIQTDAPETVLNLETGSIQVGMQADAYFTTLATNALSFNRAGSVSYINQEGIGGSLRIRTSEVGVNDIVAMQFLDTGVATLYKNVGFGGETGPETLLEMTSTAPYLTLHNSTEEDGDGGRESRLNFKGEQSGTEETTLARIEVSHDGAADDQKGKIVISTNDGADADTPTAALSIDSSQTVIPAKDIVMSGTVPIGLDMSGGTFATVAIKAPTIDTEAIENTAGDLALQTSAAGDVDVFEDGSISNTADGKVFKVWRNAPELKSSINIWTDQYKVANITSSSVGKWFKILAAGPGDEAQLVIGNDQQGVFFVGGDGTNSEMLAISNNMIFGWERTSGTGTYHTITFRGEDDDGLHPYFDVTGGVGSRLTNFYSESTVFQSGTPYCTLLNTTHEDTDGGRESRLNFKGEQSGGEATTLARIEASHDGAADDQKGKIVISTNDGADADTPTNRLEIESAGVVKFLNTGGLPFGSVYGNEIGWTQTNAVQNTWYEISDADMASGQLNAVTHDGNGQLTVSIAGMYLCNYTISGETDAGAGTHIQCTFSVSGTETNDGMNHSETIGANSQIAMSGVAILDLAASATLEVSIRTTDAGTPDISVDHLNITCVQIGGT